MINTIKPPDISKMAVIMWCEVIRGKRAAIQAYEGRKRGFLAN